MANGTSQIGPGRLEEMFPVLGDPIRQLRSEGYTDEQLLDAVSKMQGQVREEEGPEAAQFAFAPPQVMPGLKERLTQAALRGVTFGGAGEVAPPSESGLENLAEMATEFGAQIPLFFAFGPLGRLIGGTALRGLAPFAQKLITHGAAPFVGSKAVMTGARLATKGELPGLEEVFDPVEMALFGLFGAHFGLGTGRKLAKAARVLDLSDAERALARTEAIESTLYRPGQFRFTNPNVDDLTRKVLGLEPRATGAKPKQPQDLVLEAFEAGHEPTHTTARGLDPELLAAAGEDIGPAGMLQDQFRFNPLEAPEFPMPGQGPGARPMPGRVGPQPALPAVTPGTQIGRLEAFRGGVRRPAGPPEVPPGEAGTGARIVPTGPTPTGPRPSAKLENILRQMGGEVGPSGVERQAPTERIARGAGEREIPSFEGVTPSLEAQGAAGRVAGGQRGQVAVPVYELAPDGMLRRAGDAVVKHNSAVIGAAGRNGYNVIGDIAARYGDSIKLSPQDAQKLAQGYPGIQFRNPSLDYSVVAPDEIAANLERNAAARRLARLVDKQPAAPRGASAVTICMSPCVTHKTLGPAEREAMYRELLKEPTAAEQANAAVLRENTSFFSRIKAGAQAISKNFAAGSSWTSPSFVLEKTKAGLNLIRGVDVAARERARFLAHHMEDMFGTLDWKGSRVNAKVPFGEGSLEAIAAGVGLENPAALAKFTPAVRRAAGAMKDKLEELIRTYHDLRPGQKIGRITDYLPHIFDPAELEAALKADIAALRGSASPTAAARLTQAEAALERMLKGQSLLWEDVPDSIRMRFFESRNGRGGYSLDAVKAVNMYINAMARKVYVEPAVQNGMAALSEMPAEYRPFAREYMRDFLGINQRFQDPMAQVWQSVREFQFVRTIGFNPTSPIRNFFQNLNTIAELGPKHWKRGLDSALSKEGHAAFDASGHALDVPQIYLNSEIKLAPRWQKFVSYAGWMFNKVETGNRKVAYLGGLSKWFEVNAKKVGMTFQDALRKNAIPREATQFADDMVRKTQFRYGKVDLPLALRNPALGTLLQFSTFPIKQAELMWKWLTREGPAGRMKLLAYMGVGAGVARAADLIGLPMLGDPNTIPQPVDLNEMIRTAQAMTESDWAKARAAFARGTVGAWQKSFTVKFGPTGTLASDITALGSNLAKGELNAKAIEAFGRKNLSDVALNKFVAAWQQYEGGGNPADFISALAGFPTRDALIRREYLRLVEKGQMNNAKLLLNEYRKVRGGHLPLNYTKVAQIRREAKLERQKSAKELKRETPSQKIIRTFRPEIARQVL